MKLHSFCALVGFMSIVLVPQVSFRTTTDVVAVYATVQDREGHFVTDLEKNDFTVLEDGVAVDLSVFSREQQPLTLAFMLDMSGSLTGLVGHSPEAVQRLREGVLAFMTSLNAGDRASLGSFNGVEVAVGAKLTNDVVEFDRVLHEELWAGGGTPLWQAISAAMDSIAREPDRRVVLVCTDGFDSGSLPGWRGSANSVAEQAAADGTLVYVIRPPVKKPSATRPIPQQIKDLATSTGGGYVEIPPDTNLDYRAAFARVTEELRHQYLIGFVPRARDTLFHRINVRTSRNNLAVHARQSFKLSKR